MHYSLSSMMMMFTVAVLLPNVVSATTMEEHYDETFPKEEFPIVELFRRIRIYYPDWTPNALVDVGANKGEWSEVFRKLYPSTKILMLEATPKHSQRLNEVVNDIGNASFQIGVVSSTEDETIPFYQGSDTGNSMFRENSKFFEKDVPVNRTTTTLDKEISTSFLRNERVDIIKADVQGAELVVLEGGTKALEQATFVTFEASTVVYNDGGACPHEIDAFLRRYGFYLYDMSGLHYNQVAFKTFGVGQYDVLYIKPDSPHLPRQMRHSGAQFCTREEPKNPLVRPESFMSRSQIFDASYLLSHHDHSSIIMNTPVYQLSYLPPWMMGFLSGLTVAILVTRLATRTRNT